MQNKVFLMKIFKCDEYLFRHLVEPYFALEAAHLHRKIIDFQFT